MTRTRACIATLICTVSLNAQQGAPRITGQVVDSDGQPVGDAVVALVAHGMPTESHLSGNTNLKGKFAINPTEKVNSVHYSLVAWKEGYALGYVRNQTSEVYSESGAIPTARNVSITLPTPQPVTFKIVDAEGKLVAHTPVFGRAMSDDSGTTVFYSGREGGLPQLERKTDELGRVTIDYLSADNTASLDIQSAKYGSQRAAVSAYQTSDDLTLKLLPTTDLKIVFTSDEPTDLANREIKVSSRLENRAEVEKGQPILRITYGTVTLTTDANGIAQGRVLSGTASLYAPTKPDDVFFADMSATSQIKLEPGGRSEQRFKFKRGVRIRGRVVDHDDKPVAGVKIRMMTHTLTSDDNGKYETTVPATSPVYYSTMFVPDGYVMPFETFGGSITPETMKGKTEVDAADIVVGLAAKLTGIVVDQEGQPVPGATVDAAWRATGPSGSTYTRKSDRTETDQNGHFELKHVLKDVDVLLSAKTDRLASDTQTIHTEGDQHVELQVTRNGMITIVGAVRGSSGQVINNAEIRISRAMLVPDGGNYGNRNVKLNGHDSFKADETGSFAAPAKLPRHGKYAVKIGAPGYLSQQTKFLQANETGDLDIGETLLVQARNFKGTVVDSEGKPVEGAAVSAYSSDKIGDYALKKTTIKTDAHGRFTLVGIHPRAAMATLQKDGYRLAGIRLLAGTSPHVHLYRVDEPIAAEHRFIAKPLDNANRRAAAKQLIEKMMEQRRGSNYFHGELSQMLFRIDRDAMLGELENTNSPTTRAEMLSELGEIEEAAAEASGISDAYRRCLTNANLAKKCKDEELWRDILSSVLIDAEQIQRPDRRIVCLCNAADAFYAMGDKDSAKIVITSQLPQAKELSTKEWAGYARGSFAESLSLFDYDAAMKMIEEAEEGDQHRHLQNIAHRLAAVHPENAEKTLKRTTSTRYVDSPVVRVVYRMAKVDLERALGLLELINERQRAMAKARAFGVMSVSIYEDHPAKARELLKQAFEAVPRQTSSGGSRTDDIFGTALTLLRFAEQVDPENLTDYFWKTVNSYGGPHGNAWSPEQAEEKHLDRQAQMAVLLSLYEQPEALIEQVSEPIFAYWEKRAKGKNDSSRFTDHQEAFTAMALADPQRAAKWAVEFDRSLDEKRRRYIPQPFEVVGNTLTLDRHELGKQLTRKVFHRWVIDEYD